MLALTGQISIVLTMLALLTFCSQACQSGGSVLLANDLVIGQGENPNPDNYFNTVIGQNVPVLHADGQSFNEPLQVNIIDAKGKTHAVAHQFAPEALNFQVPPQIATGLATLEIISAGENVLKGSFWIRRLGVIANRGSGELIVFDTDFPESSQKVSLDKTLGAPEDVALSADGRFAHIALVGKPGVISVDITSDPPQIASDFLPAAKATAELALVSQASLALTTNFGEDTDPGESLSLYNLNGDGELESLLTELSVGQTPLSRPFGIATYEATLQNMLFALSTNRSDKSISKIDLQNCLLVISPGCAQVQTYAFGILAEPTGVAIYPDGKSALVADYNKNQIHLLDTQNQLALSTSLALEGGDQGPVALRISPGGGRALVLNEKSATLALLDLTQSSPQFFLSLPLNGQSPAKMALSHSGSMGWITFSGSDELRQVFLSLFMPKVSTPINVAGLNNPRGIAIQP